MWARKEHSLQSGIKVARCEVLDWIHPEILTWIHLGPLAGSFGQHNEPSGFVKDGKCPYYRSDCVSFSRICLLREEVFLVDTLSMKTVCDLGYSDVLIYILGDKT